MIRYEICLTDSLEKVLPDRAPRALETPFLDALKGETVSFGAAWRAVRTEGNGNGEPLTVTLAGPLAARVRARRVELEPVYLPTYAGCDDDYLTKCPGLLPDLLTPAGESPVTVSCLAEQWRSLWFDYAVTPSDAAGDYPLTVAFADAAGETVFSRTLTLRVHEAVLPPQTLYHTEWFHADCLADYYHVPVFSEEHWRILGNFMAAASRVGINMLLTPLFTPALDTEIGKERTTVQLVGVRRDKGAYTFDFSLLHRWIALCRENNITELEICHLFTQWGAAAAPKVMARTENGEERIFGWDTPAVGGEYTRFLHCFLPELRAFLTQEGMLAHSWFHISDEPSEQNRDQWKRAHDSVAGLLEGCKVLDALSDFEMYTRGFIRKPVASEDHLEPFAKAGVPGLWTYYCCGQHTDVPNRFIAMPAARARILGVLLYWYDLEGFLQWGFNFYNNAGSQRHLDPYRTADGFGAWPAGDPFLVYPAPDGTAYESLRAALMREAMQDLRALRLAESRSGRDAVLRCIESCWNGGALTMKHYPRDPAFFARLRAALLPLF